MQHGKTGTLYLFVGHDCKRLQQDFCTFICRSHQIVDYERCQSNFRKEKSAKINKLSELELTCADFPRNMYLQMKSSRVITVLKVVLNPYLLLIIIGRLAYFIHQEQQRVLCATGSSGWDNKR